MSQAARIPTALWEAQRARITKLYVEQDKTLDEVIQIMDDSGFHATKSQYIRKVNVNWKLQKNYTKEKWQHASALVEKRQAEGKLTKLSIDGKVISEKRQRKELRRYHVTLVEEEFESQPPLFGPNKQNASLGFWGMPDKLLSGVHTTGEMATGSLPLPESPRHSSNDLSKHHLYIKEQKLFELMPMLGNATEILRHQEPPWLQIFNSLVFLCSNNLIVNECSAYELLKLAISSGFLIKMKHLFTMSIPTLEIFARHLLFVALEVQGSKGIEFLNFLLESGVSPDSIHPNLGLSALQNAVVFQNRDAVQLLLQFGADPNGKVEFFGNYTPHSPLGNALKWDADGEIAKMLIESGADVNLGSEKPLIQAVKRQDLALVKLLLEAGADPKMLPAKGLSVLYFAINKHELSLVNMLIHAGVSPNLSIYEFHDIESLEYVLDIFVTPLQHAVFAGDVGIVKRLVEGGAVLDIFMDPKMFKKTHRTYLPYEILTPLQLSIQEHQYEIIKVLLDAGAGVDFRHPATGTALQLVCSLPMMKGEKIKLIETLLAKGADINSIPGESAGRTAMQAAAEYGDLDLLKLLFARGGSPFASAAKGYGLTVFQAALKTGSVELVAYVFWELGSSCSCFSFFDETNYLEETLSTGNLQLLETVLKFWNHHGLHWPRAFISSALKTAVRIGFIDHILGSDAESFTTHPFTIPEEDVSSLICESIWTRDTRVFNLLMQSFIKTDLDFSQPGYPTPLWLAIHQGGEYMAERLLNVGANPNQPSLAVCRNRYEDCCHDTGPEVPLKQAICRFDSQLIELLTNKGASIHCLIDGSLTPLLFSLQRKNESAAVFFLSKGADPNVMDLSGRYTALGFALESFVSWPTVQSLIQHGADVNMPSVWGTPLEQVARDFDQHDTMQRCQLLLAAGADVNASTEITALISAVANDNVELAKLLIEAGADVNASKTGMTALEVAVDNNNTELAKLIVGAGANVNTSSIGTCGLGLAAIRNKFELFLAGGVDANESTMGRTVLQRAASQGNLELVKLLIDLGANVNAKAPGSLTTVLQYASMQSSVEIVKYLVKHGASINEKASTVYKATALGLAVANNHNRIAIYLIEQGASTDKCHTTSGATLLQLAAKHRNHEIVTYLVENGAAVNAAPSTDRGATALQFAAIYGNLKMAVFLIEHGAHVSAKGAEVDGRTALEGAAEHGRLDMVHLLLGNDEEPETIEERCCEAAKFAETEHHDVIARILRNYKKP
ncbi:hypothetical protein LB506_004053 [Fusarium annulatum]|nr:hypothetical protein LB506_004053 [Fusarium annulatum]